METSKTIYGETPNGGVKTTAFFFDADGNPCEEKDAKTIQVLEYDKDDNCIFSIITDC